MTVLFVFLLATALGVGVAIFSGFVLSVLWAWFLVPLGAPEIGIATAIGLSMIVSLVTGKYAKALSDNEELSDTAKTVCQYLAPVVALAIGWVVQKFV